MKLRIVLSFVLFCGLFTSAFAQDDDLLKSLDSGMVEPKKEMNVGTAFKALQVVNIQSTKTPAKKELYMIVSHRFGNMQLNNMENFADNFFGMDNARTKLGFIYGINDWFSLGISRQTAKLYELGIKYRLALQSADMPVTIVGYNTINADTSLKEATYPLIKFQDKLSYTTQLHLSRMLNDKVSLQLSGIWVHKNLIKPEIEQKDQQVLAAGGRIKISNRVTINGEYGYRFSPVENTVFKNPYSVGVDIDTGGHVFQLTLGNSQMMNDVAYFTGANGDVSKGSIFLGFNMYRVF